MPGDKEKGGPKDSKQGEMLVINWTRAAKRIAV